MKIVQIRRSRRRVALPDKTANALIRAKIAVEEPLVVKKPLPQASVLEVPKEAPKAEVRPPVESYFDRLLKRAEQAEGSESSVSDLSNDEKDETEKKRKLRRQRYKRRDMEAE